MSKQEEIREGLISKIISIRAWSKKPEDPLSVEDDVEDILNYLHSQGVVIAGNSLGFTHPHLANYFSIEPLVDNK